MKKPIVLFIFTYLFLINSFSAENDSLIYTNHIFDKDIKSVLLYKDGWHTLLPGNFDFNR